MADRSRSALGMSGAASPASRAAGVKSEVSRLSAAINPFLYTSASQKMAGADDDNSSQKAFTQSHHDAYDQYAPRAQMQRTIAELLQHGPANN